MHQPRPHGKFGQEDATRDDLAFAESLMRHVTNIKQTAGLDNFKLVRALPDGGMVVAMDMGGIVKTIIHKPPREGVQEEAEGDQTTDVPMLFSGIVDRTVLRGGEKPVLKLTKQTQKRLQGYGKDKKTRYNSAERQELERFNIPYSVRFSEFEPKNAVVTHTQYVQLRASWYSGAMAQVVQIVSGYGKSKFDSKPANATELAKMVIPEGVKAAIAKELGDAPLPGYTGKPPVSGQIQFEYKFYDQNAVAFASDGKPWLLKLSSAGVYAMPLPLIPATTTKAFRKWIEDVGDDEILWILDRFKGMPSGEGFPPTRSQKAWERAGVIIKVCDTGDFYQHSPYSSAMGWSFNTRGDTAYGTCLEEEGEVYIEKQSGHTYCMSLSLGATQKPEREKLDAIDARAVSAYLTKVAAAARKDKTDGAAVRYKLRMSMGIVVQRAKTSNGEDYDFWKNYEMPKLAQHSGSVTKTSTGALYHPNKVDFQPQIKFPEPFMGGCISHTFANHKSAKAKCDTIMHTYFVGDDLKVVKYFYDDSEADPGKKSDFEECMTVGTWTETVDLTPKKLMGNFHTSDFDDRKQASENSSTTTIVGKDLGYSSTPGFEFDDFFSCVGTVYRKRYYTHKVDAKHIRGYRRELAVCIPYTARDAALYARNDTINENFKTESFGLKSITDPNSYRMYTYDFVYAWVGGPSGGNSGSVDVQSLARPKDGNPVWITGYNHSPSACSDFADNGSWISIPADYTWLVHPQKGVWNHSKNDVGPNVTGYHNATEVKWPTYEGDLQLSVLEQKAKVHSNTPRPAWFLRSPNPYLGVFHVGVYTTKAGNSIYASCSERDNDSDPFPHWGYTRLADHRSGHCFIGVINE